MADVQEGQGSLLARKWGPLPVWAWAAITLVLAWIYAKWRSSKTAAATTTTTDPTASQTDAVAPQFVIENNLPGPQTGTQASTPVVTPSGPTPPPVVTPPGVIAGPPVVKPPPVRPPVHTKKPPLEYKVVHGDTLTSIAARYHTTADALFKFNTTPGVRPAKTIATLKKRGPDLIVGGETILIPQ